MRTILGRKTSDFFRLTGVGDVACTTTGVLVGVAVRVGGSVGVTVGVGDCVSLGWSEADEVAFPSIGARAS